MYHEYLQRVHTLPPGCLRHKSEHSGNSPTLNNLMWKPVLPILFHPLDSVQRTQQSVYVNEISMILPKTENRCTGFSRNILTLTLACTNTINETEG